MLNAIKRLYIDLRQQIYFSTCDNSVGWKAIGVGRIVFAPTSDKNKNDEKSAANAYSPV